MNRLDLYSRLRGLRKSDLPRPVGGNPIECLNEKIGGEIVSRPTGSIVRIFRKIPYNSMHGGFRLYDPYSVDTCLLELLFRGIDQPVSLKDMLFFDIETTGLSGGAGTVVFLIGFLTAKEEGLEFTQLFLNSLSSQHLFLEHVKEHFAPYRYLVSYNGKSFDFNIIKNRFVMQGMRFEEEGVKHLDLLYTSRRIWKGLLPDFSLATVERRILDVKRTQDIPGWRVPEVYAHFLRGRDVYEDMKAVFSHNRDDVLSLLALLVTQLRVVAQAGEGEKAHGLDRSCGYDPVSVSRFFEAHQQRQKAVNILSSNLEDTEAMKSLALLHKKDGCFEQALQHFKQLCEKRVSLSDFLFACTEIAKIYEHRIRDFQQALSFTQMMLDRLKRAEYFYPPDSMWFESALESVNRRYSRLLRKIGRIE